MDQNDFSNLNFLLTINEEGMKLWLDQASEDDVAYANELLNSYCKQLACEEWELDTRVQELETELKVEMLNGNYPEARSVLSKFVRNLG